MIAKQGEYGARCITRDGGTSGCTAYPTADIVEPTGAGDTFAGGLMGSLAAHEGEIDDGDAAPRDGLRHGAAPPSTSRASAPSGSTARPREIDARVADLER